MTRRERMMITVAALGGDGCWVRTEDAVSAAHMEDGAFAANLRALVEAGQLEVGPGRVRLTARYDSSN